MDIIRKVVILAIMLVAIPSSYAQSYFGINLDCIDGCQGKTIEVNKPVMLKLEIRNNFDYWVSLGNKDYGAPTFRMTIKNANLQGSWAQASGRTDVYDQISGKVFFIKPKSSEIFYIPLDAYNTLEEDKRLGQWEIEYELDTNSAVRYYENPYTGKEVQIKPEFQIPRIVKGNILSLKGIKPEVTIVENPDAPESFSSKLKRWLTEEPYRYFSWIIGSILIGVVIYSLTTGRRRRK